MNRWLQILLIVFLFVSEIPANGQEDSLSVDSILAAPISIKETSASREHWMDFGEYDSLHYQYSEIPETTIDEYRKNPDFRYKRKGKNDQLGGRKSLFEQFFEAIIGLLEKLFNFSLPETSFVFLKYLLGFAFVILIIYVISQLVGVNLNFNFKRKAKPKLDDLSFETIEENLEEINFDELLEQAIKEGRYRIAIRLFFLKNLQQLSKKEKINWSIDKTNNDYKYELATTPLISGFDQTVYLFEYIWYGNFDLSDLEFQKALNTFRNFQNQIIREQ